MEKGELMILITNKRLAFIKDEAKAEGRHEAYKEQEQSDMQRAIYELRADVDYLKAIVTKEKTPVVYCERRTDEGDNL